MSPRYGSSSESAQYLQPVFTLSSKMGICSVLVRHEWHATPAIATPALRRDGRSTLYAFSALWFLLVPGTEAQYVSQWLPGLMMSGIAVGLVLPSASAPNGRTASGANPNANIECPMKDTNMTEATLDNWQRQLEQVRQRRLERGILKPGLARPEQVRGLTGLQVMTALLEGDLPHPHMAETFDCELIEVGDGLAVFQATPQLKHHNPLGSVPGGWYATLLDFALGCAVQTRLPAGTGYTTTQINLKIVRAARTQTGPLRCVETALHVGRQIGTSEARIVDVEGTLDAHAMTTCAIFEAR